MIFGRIPCDSIVGLVKRMPDIWTIANLMLVNGHGFIHKLVERISIKLALSRLTFGGDGEKLDFRIEIIELSLRAVRPAVFSAMHWLAIWPFIAGLAAMMQTRTVDQSVVGRRSIRAIGVTGEILQGILTRILIRILIRILTRVLVGVRIRVLKRILAGERIAGRVRLREQVQVRLRIGDRATVQVTLRIALRVQVDLRRISLDHVTLLQVVSDQMLIQVGAVYVVRGDLLGSQIPLGERIFSDRPAVFVRLVAFLVGLTFSIDSRSNGLPGHLMSD